MFYMSAVERERREKRKDQIHQYIFVINFSKQKKSRSDTLQFAAKDKHERHFTEVISLTYNLLISLNPNKYPNELIAAIFYTSLQKYARLHHFTQYCVSLKYSFAYYNVCSCCCLLNLSQCSITCRCISVSILLMFKITLILIEFLQIIKLRQQKSD